MRHRWAVVSTLAAACLLVSCGRPTVSMARGAVAELDGDQWIKIRYDRATTGRETEQVRAWYRYRDGDAIFRMSVDALREEGEE